MRGSHLGVLDARAPRAHVVEHGDRGCAMKLSRSSRPSSSRVVVGSMAREAVFTLVGPPKIASRPVLRAGAPAKRAAAGEPTRILPVRRGGLDVSAIRTGAGRHQLLLRTMINRCSRGAALSQPRGRQRSSGCAAPWPDDGKPAQAARQQPRRIDNESGIRARGHAHGELVRAPLVRLRIHDELNSRNRLVAACYKS